MTTTGAAEFLTTPKLELESSHGDTGNDGEARSSKGTGL
jgi:hypothetical protein